VEFEDVLRFINLLCSGVAAGILILVAIAVMPTLMTFPPSTVVRFKAMFDPAVDRINPPFVLLSMITGVLLLFVGDPTSTQVIFTIIGIVGSIGVAATSLGVNMRINRTMATWDADNPPAEFGPQIARWLGVHRIRTLSGTVAFICYIVAALGA
jgi:uncharacterized membrane protein